ncbi:MAG TPA: tyrosine-protein phosphatase [Bryobacteraceae bacterium]|nr:tyrosine-protein phosphatase [Bryobacteraceae bacterium]
MKISRFRKTIAALALSLSVAAGTAAAGTIAIPNFHQVNDHLYRGGQPAPEAWQSLAQMGVKTVIDLRREDEHSTAAEAQAVKAAGMAYVNVPMKGVVAPTNEQIAKILSLLDSPGPVFVHCKRGADRTGAVIACYRIAHDRWQREQALQEAKSFGMGSFQIGLKSYVKSFQPSQAQAPAAAVSLP